MSSLAAARRLASSGPRISPLVSGLPDTPLGPCGSLAVVSAPSLVQRRSKWSDHLFKGWTKSRAKKTTTGRDPDPAVSDLDDAQKRQEYLRHKMQSTVEDNIFQDEIDAASSPAIKGSDIAEDKTRASMAMATDPDPRSRIRWQRKTVIRMVRNNGQLTTQERIKMTEREHLHKSPFFPTSVKKLVMLARQIAGKPVDDAIRQMEWSKKKMAAEMKYYLEEARDLAVVQRGMGLGKVNGQALAKPRKIRAKDGKWINVSDPTRIYVAQSWVGRGPWRGKRLDYRSRGRFGIIQHPSTSFSVVLKEEKTRLREHDERESKKAAKGPWIHLPNRPVYGQRPYYSW